MLDARGALVLINERMEASLAVLAHEMGWDLRRLAFQRGDARTSKSKQWRCDTDACRDAVLSCNRADAALYERYRAALDARLARDAAALAPVHAAFEARWKAPSRGRDAGDWARSYPIVCKHAGDGGTPAEKRWHRLHACGGSLNKR